MIIGSGGGSSLNGIGGQGGGFLHIATAVNSSGSLVASGLDGTGGGGGGSGGSVSKFIFPPVY